MRPTPGWCAKRPACRRSDTTDRDRSEPSMALHADQEIELRIEKPAAGGRMIARHDGQIVLVLGAIPGERVRARIERVERQVAFATVTVVEAASADRRGEPGDLLCGGCLYAHAEYPRQLALKAAVLEDAFTRLGRIQLPDRVDMAPSPERGYRMRARLHVRGGRAGFYREGTHEPCDPAPTGQLSEAALASTQAAIDALAATGCAAAAVELTENLAANERVLHVTAAPGAEVTNDALDAALGAGTLAGISGRTRQGTLRASGVPVVADPIPALTSGR